MSKESAAIIAKHEEPKLKVASYTLGFVLSIVLTLTAYLIVVHHIASTKLLEGAVVILALSQFLVQIFFFLHLGQDTKPRWKVFVFFFMLGVVLILVFGSIWIINSLNYRQTLPQELRYMNSQGGF